MTVRRVNMRSVDGAEVTEWQAQGVAAVELCSNSLTRLPPELAGLAPTLTALTVRWNLLTTLPASIGRLRLLQTLDLSFNRLEQLPPQLCSLHNLSVLCLSDNELSVLPDGMGGCSTRTSACAAWKTHAAVQRYLKFLVLPRDAALHGRARLLAPLAPHVNVRAHASR